MKPYTIVNQLKLNEGITVSRFGVAKFLKVYGTTGSISRRPGSGRPSKITPEIKEQVDKQMEANDVTTAY